MVLDPEENEWITLGVPTFPKLACSVWGTVCGKKGAEVGGVVPAPIGTFRTTIDVLPGRLAFRILLPSVLRDVEVSVAAAAKEFRPSVEREQSGEMVGIDSKLMFL